MNEKYATYTEIKHPPAKKQMQKEKRKDQPVYSEVKIHTSNSNQTKTRKTQSSIEKGSSVPFAWCLTVVILGICCFFLLLTVGVLGFYVFQAQKTSQAQNLLWDNATQEDKSTFKNTTFKELPVNTESRNGAHQSHKISVLQMTRTQSLSPEVPLRDNTEWPLGHIFCFQGNKNGICKTQWSCCENKCYHFSSEMKDFEDSRKLCKTMGSKLVKIEDEKQLNFIQNRVSYFTWIGLSRKGISNFWTWEDNSPPFLKMSIYWKESKDGKCASVTADRITPYDCSKLMYFICEKKIASVAI